MIDCSSADLQKAMHCIFGQFGNIIDVVSRRTYKLRGQAWVVFEKEEDAKKAMAAMQGFPFFNKPIVSNIRCKLLFLTVGHICSKKLFDIFLHLICLTPLLVAAHSTSQDKI